MIGKATVTARLGFKAGSTTANIASALATAINNDGNASVTATSSGYQLILTSKQTGSATSYPVSVSWTYNSGGFSSPSFTVSAPSALSGGQNGASDPNAFNETYTIDPWGNLKESGSFNFTQLFSTNNQIYASGYTYDAAGDLTADGLGNTYTYNVNGMLIASDGVQYLYDGLNQRVDKVGGTNRGDTIYFGGRPIALYSTSSYTWTDLIWAGNMMFAEVAGTQTAVPVYRLLNHLGSLAMTTDGSGNVTGTNLMTPYGETLSSTTSDSFQFAGLYQDPEYGGDHAMFRNYSTEQTRWLRPDPYNGSYDLTNPQSFNRYMYVNGNPLAFTDPSGQGSACVDGICVPWFPGVLNTVGSVVNIGLFAANFLNDVFGLWGQPPTFNGNLQASQSGKNVPQNQMQNCNPTWHPCTTVHVNGGPSASPSDPTASGLPNTLPLAGLASWPLNGNLWPGFTPQDGVCTTGPFAGAMNGDSAMLKCCQAHDACFTKYQCNFSSFLGGLPGPCRVICDATVTACLLTAP